MSVARDVERADAKLPANAEQLTRLLEDLRVAGYTFTTITPRSHGIVNGRPGADEARSLRDVFGWSRPFRRDLLPPELLKLLAALGLVEAHGDRMRSRIRVSSLRGDLLVHSAHPTEAADAVFFGPDTYKFVDAIVDCLARRKDPVRRAVDICSGAGPGAITIARAHPEADVFMADINRTALWYGAANAAQAGLDNVSGRLSDKLADVPGAFDVIVAHPPYLIDATTRAYRHGGGSLGADLALAIVDEALGRLAPGGTLLLFTGVAIVDGHDAFAAKVCGWAAEHGCDWSYLEVDPDVFGEELATPAYGATDRIALVVFEATRRATA